MTVTKRFNKILSACNGKVLHLGGTNEDLQMYLLKKNVNCLSVDIRGDPDFKQDLNEKQWRNIKGKYDTILATEIIEHIADPIQFIKNCRNLLNNRGKLIITTPNATSLIHLYNPGWCVFHKELYIHIHLFTPPILENILIKNNFKINKSEYLNEFLFNRIGWLIAELFPRLRGDIFIVAEKDDLAVNRN